MASEASKQMKNMSPDSSDNRPKHKKLIQMLSFRVVPAYYKEIEKVADNQKTTVSKSTSFCWISRSYYQQLINTNFVVIY